MVSIISLLVPIFNSCRFNIANVPIVGLLKDYLNLSYLKTAFKHTINTLVDKTEEARVAGNQILSEMVWTWAVTWFWNQQAAAHEETGTPGAGGK